MQRRARIKAVANLSNVRRGTNKNSTESQQDIENSKKDIKEQQTNDIHENSTNQEGQLDINVPQVANVNQSISDDPVETNDDVNDNLLEKLTEKSNEANNISQTTASDSVNNVIKPANITIKQENFKTPENLIPRAENEKSSSKKFRKPKITPRLNISRATAKVQVCFMCLKLAAFNNETKKYSSGK